MSVVKKILRILGSIGIIVGVAWIAYSDVVITVNGYDATKYFYLILGGITIILLRCIKGK